MNKRLKFEVLLREPIPELQHPFFLKPSCDSNISKFFSRNEEDEMPEDVAVTKFYKTQVVHNWLPQKWKQQLENIRLMRQRHTAPIDEMGCQKCVDLSSTDQISRFQLLLSLMLSSQTKDQITFEAMKKIKSTNCTPNTILSLSDEDLGKLIYPVSFWKRKVQYIKKTSKILLERYDGDIPSSVEELCGLPGVGPKIAHLCMQVAWKKLSGIAVDTHVHRISNRLKWVPKPTKTAEQTRISLEAWLPKNLWAEINYLFVGFGQEICKSQRPKCENCLNNSICPYKRNRYNF